MKWWKTNYRLVKAAKNKDTAAGTMITSTPITNNTTIKNNKSTGTRMILQMRVLGVG